MKTYSWKRPLLLLLFFLCSRLVTFAAGVVTSADESSLRTALVGGGTVTFAVDGTITLANSIIITNDTLLDGSGRTVTISGGNAVRVFQVNTNVQFTLQNLNIANGRTNQGAGLFNAGGTVTVTNCTFTNNQAIGATGTGGMFPGPGQPGSGGAIYNTGGLTLLNVNFAGNVAAGGVGGTPSGVPEGSGGAGGAGSGGALYNAGMVSATNVSFNGNAANGGNGGNAVGSGGGFSTPGAGGSAFGGGVFNQGASMSASNCSFVANGASAGFGPVHNGRSSTYRGQGRGGAFYNSTSTVAMVAGTITNSLANGSPASGGAIHQEAGTLTLANVAIVKNSTVADRSRSVGITASGSLGSGGALHNSGSATLTDCNVSSNGLSGGPATSGAGAPSVAGGDAKGAGIYNSGTVGLRRCAMTGNSGTPGSGAGIYPAGTGYGGGVMNEGGGGWAANCTVAFNTITGLGGGIYNGATLTNCTLYGNNASGGGGNLGGSSSSLRNTILAAGVPSNGGYSDAGNNVVSASNPNLGPLGNYGGPTPTIPLLAGSPALDAANNASAPATDQRGRARPSGASSDGGAFESSAPYVVMGRFIGVNTQDSAYITLNGQGTNVISGGSFRYDGLAAGAYSMTASNADRAVIPSTRNLTLGPDVTDADFTTYLAAGISVPPQSQPVVLGSNVTLTVTASGDDLNYQWRYNGTNLSGATGSALTLTNFQSANAGPYVVVVTNLLAVTTSAPPAALTLVTVPTILVQPQSRTNFAGDTVVFQVSASGTAPLNFRWRKGTTPLTDDARVSGSTSGNLTIANLAPGDAGSYSVVVSNTYGTATSSNASLTVQIGLAQALGAALPWTVGGNVPWFTQTNVTHDGVAAAQSGVIADGQTSSLSANVIGPGTVTFWWKVSSEEDTDYLRFLISGTAKVKISGEVDWQQKSFAVPVGPQVLQWTYTKDVDVASGSDAGWLDEVRFENSRLDYISWNTNSGFQFRLDGMPVGNYVVLASTNLTNWVPIATNAVTASSPAIFVDPAAAGFSFRFYRAQQQ